MQAEVDLLTEAGVRAVLDQRDVNPPCVLVRPPVLTFRFGRGYDAAWTYWLIVPDSGQAAVLDALGELIDATITALGFTAVAANPDDVTLGDGSNHPMYTLTRSTRIERK
jgi:hypothetical protein